MGGTPRVGQKGLQRAIHAIVLDALSRSVGGTLATNGELQQQVGVGAGTVQRALDLLADRGALRTTARGHLGRRIDAISLGDCWQAAGLAPVRISMSTGGPIELDALEAALSDELTRMGIPHGFAHVRGGNGRLADVSAGRSDIAVVSAGTYRCALDSLGLDGLGPARLFPPGTYYAPERLVVLRGPAAADRGLARTVAIDRQSFDHEALTMAEFPIEAGFTHVDMHFTEVPARVLAGIVATGIWHVTESPFPLFLTGLEAVPLVRPQALTVMDALSGAAMVGRAGRSELAAVLHALELGSLVPDQQQALEDERAWLDSFAAEAAAVTLAG